jgi:TPR repeat protein
VGQYNEYLLELTLHSEFEEGCNQNSPDACFSLGEWHQLIAKDEEKAGEIYAKNCNDRSHPSSCFNLAMLLISKRIKVPQNMGPSRTSDQVARTLLRRGCELKDGSHGQACAAYATVCLSGTGGPRDLTTGLQTLSKLCDPPHNDGRACVRLGSAFLRGGSAYPGVQRDPQAAFTKMKRACDDLGHPNGCQVLAVMYAKGDGVSKNDELAEKYRLLTKELILKTGEKLGSIAVEPVT